MLADPAAGSHPDRRDLAALQPDTGAAGDALSRQIKLGQEIDHHLLKAAQIEVQVGAAATQIEHGIKHQLAGGVMGHLPATVDAVQGQGWSGRIEVEVLQAGAAAERVAGLVLQQQQRLGRPRIRQEARLQGPLPAPGPLERHRRLGNEKICCFGGLHRAAFLAWAHPGETPPRR